MRYFFCTKQGRGYPIPTLTLVVWRILDLGVMAAEQPQVVPSLLVALLVTVKYKFCGVIFPRGEAASNPRPLLQRHLENGSVWLLVLGCRSVSSVTRCLSHTHVTSAATIPLDWAVGTTNLATTSIDAMSSCAAFFHQQPSADPEKQPPIRVMHLIRTGVRPAKVDGGLASYPNLHLAWSSET